MVKDGVAIKGVPGKRMHADDPIGFLRGRDRNLAAEFVFFVSLAFGDAANLRRVDAVDLVLCLLTVFLAMDFLCDPKDMGEPLARLFYLALDIPDHAAEHGAEPATGFARLQGVFAVPGTDVQEQHLAAKVSISLRQGDAGPLRGLDEHGPGAIIELGVGRWRNVLRLNRRIDVHVVEVRWLGDFGAEGEVNGLFDHGLGPFDTDVVTPFDE